MIEKIKTVPSYKMAIPRFLTAAGFLVTAMFVASGILKFSPQYFATYSINLVIIIPLVCLALYRSKVSWSAKFLMVCLLILISGLAISLSAPSLFAQLHWNWVGKTFSILVSLLFLANYPELSATDAGVTLKLTAGSLRPAIIFMVVVIAIFTGLAIALTQPNSKLTLETIAFQATMPGFDEELLFRGIVLAILNQIFGRRWKLWGASIGWGLILTSILFGLLHGLAISKSWQLVFDPLTCVVTGILGFLFGWLRERTASIGPSIILHNLINSLPF